MCVCMCINVYAWHSEFNYKQHSCFDVKPKIVAFISIAQEGSQGVTGLLHQHENSNND